MTLPGPFMTAASQMKMVWYSLSKLYVPLEVSVDKVHELWNESGLHGYDITKEVLENMQLEGLTGNENFNRIARAVLYLEKNDGHGNVRSRD